MSTRPSCGKHTELASNPAVRITRCSCGTVHVTVISSGVTVRMNTETMGKVAAGFRAAQEHVETVPAVGTAIN